MAGPARPFWWPYFIAAERAIGGRLERVTHSDEFAEALTLAAAVQDALRAHYVQATAAALHRANLPARSDLRRLSEQVTALERRLADLEIERERAAGGRPGVRPRSSRRRRPASDQ